MTRSSRWFAGAAGLSALLSTMPAAGQVLQAPLPQRLPLPCAHLTLTPGNDEEAAYLHYLRTTRVFPDEAVCTRELQRRTEGKIGPDSLQVD